MIETQGIKFDQDKMEFHHLHPKVLAHLFPSLAPAPMFQWFYAKQSLLDKDMGKLLGEISPVLQLGAKKYGTHNYCNGLEYSRVFNAWCRHTLFNVAYGPDPLDPESRLPHAAHAACNELFALTYELIGLDGSKFDNRPTITL